MDTHTPEELITMEEEDQAIKSLGAGNARESEKAPRPRWKS